MKVTNELPVTHLTFYPQHFVKELSAIFLTRSASLASNIEPACYDIPMADKFRVGLIQMSSTQECRRQSRPCDRQDSRSRQARRANYLSWTNCFCGEYFCRTEEAALFDLAEPIPGPTTDSLGKIAKENNVALAVSIFERRAAGHLSQFLRGD